MVAARSRIKHADSAAHSSGRNGGDSRVFESPAIGVLHTMPIATDCTQTSLVPRGGAAPLGGHSLHAGPLLHRSRNRVVRRHSDFSCFSDVTKAPVSANMLGGSSGEHARA